MKTSNFIPFFLIIGIILILAAFFNSVRSNSPSSFEKIIKQTQTKTKIEPTTSAAPTITAADPILGPANAQITIVEYADFRCPHCAEANFELKKIHEAYPDKVRFVWKDFPFLPPVNVTWLAHEAARCAEKQGKFWEYHDALFMNQDNLSRENLLALAKEFKLDENQFVQCLESGQTKPLIQRGFEEGKAVGVDYAPYFFMNGEKWNGEMTVEKIGKMIK
ncbi:MAG: DsbA family protein [Candidatus Magasanikbacteria bacterium]|nr:DsbA family protein [Candidatus Magasanikbacteria bacterium]